ncbi:restriction endonuclease [Arthrobacter livingstonensis]|uniref:Restriction endonuclease n=1 Tax=Arthrobacter livingstonensis TaxID=670078 RepID=A0A2V5LD36_9MICC|nr:restriction endonuclease subunit S [Arthrobacter livingstonensis]PYI69601.1 restriction endonuclease [Arthrobacter livingstonensis]
MFKETHWGEVATLKYGKALGGYRDDPAASVPVFGTNGPVGFTQTAQVPRAGVIIGRKGAYRGVHYSSVPFSVIDTAYYLEPADFVDNRWAYYALQLADINGLDSGSAIPSTTRDAFYSLRVSVPSVDEQLGMVEVLGALDDKIAANTKLAGTFEALGAVKFQALGINTEPDIDSVTLDTLFDVNPRRTPGTDPVPLIDMQALPTSSPLIETWSAGPKKGGTRFMNGDTLLARITPCLENRKTGFVDFLEDGQVGIGSTEFIVIRSREGLPLGLSYFMATSNRFRDFAIQNMVGTSGRQRVAASDIARFEFNPICASELEEFGTWADTNLSLLGSLRTENNMLAATRDALLPQLMSGKLRVKDAESLVSAAV